MKKWIVTGLVAAALAALWLSFHWWLSTVFPFLKTYSTEIDTAMKILVPAGTVLAFLITQWFDRPDKQTSSGGVGVNQTAQGGGINVAGAAKPEGDMVARDKITIIQPAAAQTPGPYLHQLPPPPGDFTGREQEMRELMAAIEKGGVTISGLQGMGGVGKTALALKLAEQLTPRYADAQFYLDLKGVSKEPVTPKGAMEHVIRAYHPDAKLPEGETGLGGLYRSVLHNQKAILLMDNARDARQVEPLIPPQSCTLLVTSRQHFSVPGLVEKNLEALSPADARALLIRIAPRLAQEKKDYASDLARLCGYLPLALRSVASALTARIDLSPADYVQKLTDAQERLKLTATGASLQLSYDLLTADLQKRFRSLAVFPDSFELAGATAVWATKYDAAKDALGELLVYSLLEFNSATGRYRLHDLVRVFADARLEQAERELTEKRHAEHYKNALATADQLYKKGGEWVTQGLALFDLEWGNIQAGQAWAAARASEDMVAAQLCSLYPNAGVYCLNLRMHPRERIEWLKASLMASRQLKDRSAEGAHLGNLGNAYHSLDEYRRAIEYHEQDLNIAREIRDQRGVGGALGNLGLMYYSLGEYDRAIGFYEQALVIDREIGDRRGEGNALGNLGLTYYSLGEYRRAIEYHEQDLKIAREIGDRRGEGNALGNLGIAYESLGEYRRAIEHSDQALKIAREIGDRRGEGNALGNLGIAYESLGEYRRATENYEQILKIARETGDRRMEGTTLGNLGIAHESLGEYRRAMEYHEQALVIDREIGNRMGEGQELGNLGNAHQSLGEYRRGILYYEQRLQIAREIGDQRGEGSALWNTSLAFEKLGDRAKAIVNGEAALKIYEALEHPSVEKVRNRLAEWRGEA